jgi:hypothetical protein
LFIKNEEEFNIKVFSSNSNWKLKNTS